jgi:hypothetical protein
MDSVDLHNPKKTEELDFRNRFKERFQVTKRLQDSICDDICVIPTSKMRWVSGQHHVKGFLLNQKYTSTHIQANKIL